MVRANPSIEGLKPSATLAINQQVKALRAANTPVYHFGFGQSPFPIFPAIVEALKEHATNNHYLPTIGLEPLRAEIVRFLNTHQNISADPDYVYIGPGSKELLYQTILILEGVFLIPKGSWVSYGPQIHSRKGAYVVLETQIEHNFKLQPETLEAYCREHPDLQKSLILNSPNNPTGAVYSNEELERLATVCRAHGVIVLSDEIYSQINFNADHSPSMSWHYPELTIVYGGLSKVFSAGGYRLGYMALPENLRHLHQTFRAMFSETFSAVASPVQYAAIEAFKMKDDLKHYIARASTVLSGVSQYVYSNLTAAGLECTNPMGAFYMMIGFNNFRERVHNLGIHTGAQLAAYLLDRYQTALLPASDFYFDESALLFRLAFVDFDGDRVLQEYNKSTVIDEAFRKAYCPNIYAGVQRLLEFANEDQARHVD